VRLVNDGDDETDGLPFWEQRITVAERQPTPEMSPEALLGTLAILMHDLCVVVDQVLAETKAAPGARTLLADVKTQVAFLSGLARGHDMRQG